MEARIPRTVGILSSESHGNLLKGIQLTTRRRQKKTEEKTKTTKRKGHHEKEERFVNPTGKVFDEEKPSKGE
jgi:hypothetical protein